MNKKISILIFLLLSLFSCKQQKDEHSVPYEQYWQVIRGAHPEIYYLPLTVEQTIYNGYSVLTYQSQFNSSIYTIDTRNPQKSEFKSSNFNEKLFNLVAKHNLSVEGKDFKVYQFSTADGTIDFGSEHYWNKQLGFFFIRGTYWSNFSVLQFSDEEKNKEVWKIVHQLYPTIETSLKLAGVKKGFEHIRQEHQKVIR